MNKYILNSEKAKINTLTEELSKSLKVNENNITKIKNKFYNIIRTNKDSSIEDIIASFIDSLAKELEPLLKENITPGLQAGIKNKYFSTKVLGGYYNNHLNKPIEEDTMFSFDSIAKLLTSSIILKGIENNDFNLSTTIHELDESFNLNTSIESILKYTALIRTEKRIDNLSRQETISILKKVHENLEEKEKYKNFYEYNDIGYIILRLSINNFLEKLNNILELIDKNNLTYKNYQYKDKITGGKINEEFITPDTKGRDIIFPGHTGLYGNIDGLINLFYKIIYTEDIISNNSKTKTFQQPYTDPIVYNSDGSQKLGKNNSPQYMAKIAGIYRKPNGITNPNYDKLASCDMSNNTTDKAIASTGTCGSWVVGDNLEYNNKFSIYIGGLLTNPYTLVNKGTYKNKINNIPNSNIQVNSKGVILGYQTKLNKYKEIITEYGLLLELLTEYIKEQDKQALNNAKKTLIRHIK